MIDVLRKKAMTKCTREESAAMAEKVDLYKFDSGEWLADERELAHMIDRAREPLQAKIDSLFQAIRQTLDENGHLADGENCTLIVLKRALREVGVPWKGDESPNARETLARAAPAAAEKAKG